LLKVYTRYSQLNQGRVQDRLDKNEEIDKELQINQRNQIRRPHWEKNSKENWIHT
jgi:hypothetical protein